MSLDDTVKEWVREMVREELKSAPPLDPLLTAEQVAEILAFPNVRSVYKLKREKKLRYVEFGENSFRFRQSDVQRFIEQRVQ